MLTFTAHGFIIHLQNYHQQTYSISWFYKLALQLIQTRLEKYMLSLKCSERISLCAKICSVRSAQMDDCAKYFSASSAEMDGCAENFATRCVPMGTTRPKKSTKWSNKPKRWTKWQKLTKNVNIIRKVYKTGQKAIQTAKKDQQNILVSKALSASAWEGIWHSGWNLCWCSGDLKKLANCRCAEIPSQWIGWCV